MPLHLFPAPVSNCNFRRIAPQDRRDGVRDHPSSESVISSRVPALVGILEIPGRVAHFERDLHLPSSLV